MTDEQYIERLKFLTTTARTQASVKEAFDLYNQRMTPKETKHFCGGCTERVFKRLNQYLEQHGKTGGN